MTRSVVQLGGQALKLDADGDTTIEVSSDDVLVIDTAGNAALNIDANGHITKPLQSAFLAVPASDQTSIAVGSEVVVVFGTEVFDQNGDFASNTFTAPVTGRYQLNVAIRLTDLDSASNYYYIRIVTSNRTYYQIFDPDFGQDAAYWNLSIAVLADMDASDTAFIYIAQANGTQQTDVHTASSFSGYLVA
jgi:hypothetical protein